MAVAPAPIVAKTPKPSLFLSVIVVTNAQMMIPMSESASAVCNGTLLVSGNVFCKMVPLAIRVPSSPAVSSAPAAAASTRILSASLGVRMDSLLDGVSVPAGLGGEKEALRRGWGARLPPQPLTRLLSYCW